MNVYVLGSAIFAATPLSAAQADGASAADARAAARRVFLDLPADQFPNLASMAVPLTAGDAEARFLYGLEDLIAGIAARAAAPAAGDRPTKRL